MRITLCLLISTLLVGCASRQIDGWYQASLDADIANYESIVASSDIEPEEKALAAMRTLGAIARARYQLDHLSANVGEFKRSDTDWMRMTDDILSAYGTVRRLSALPADELAQGTDNPEIAAGLEEVRLVVGRWGGAPQPERGSRRIKP
jgi:hypothetical protein